MKPKKNLLSETVSMLFIFLFVYAASSKLIEYQKFRIELSKSPLLTIYANYVAVIVPVLEFIIAFLLMFRKQNLLGLYASFTLMIVFTAYIIDILNFSEYIPCSCGGILQNMTWNQHLVFNGAFIALAFLGVIFFQPAEESSVEIS